MPNEKPTASKMPNLISRTKERINTPPENAANSDDLGSLVGSFIAPSQQAPSAPTASEPMRPQGYFEQQPQITQPRVAKVKVRPVKEIRDQHITLRISLTERDQFTDYCTERNLSSADGLKSLLAHFHATTKEG